MKSKIMIIIVLLCFIGFSTACKDDDTNTNNCPLAKTSWKLVSMEIVTNSDIENAEIIDYSESNCIYDFQGEKNYKKVNNHWTPKFKLFIYNNVPAHFPNEIQSGSGEEYGNYYYQYRNPSDYFLPDGTHTDYSCNLIINKIDGSCEMGLWCFVNTDTIVIRTGQTGQFLDEYGNAIQWSKYFVKIKDIGSL